MGKSKERKVRDYVADQHKAEAGDPRKTYFEGAMCRGTEYKVRHGHYHPADPRHPSRREGR